VSSPLQRSTEIALSHVLDRLLEEVDKDGQPRLGQETRQRLYDAARRIAEAM
jgi:hypothetical protein